MEGNIVRKKGDKRDTILLTLRQARFNVGTGQIGTALSQIDQVERLIRDWNFSKKGAYLSKG